MKTDDPTDECCKQLLASDNVYMLRQGTTTHALAREVLRLRALERAVRQLVEAADIDAGGQKVASWSYVDSGQLAEILNRAERAK